MDKRWTVLGSRTLHEGRPHRLRLDHCRTPAGVEVHDYFVREVNDVAIVFALTPGREVVLVRQYRHGLGRETLELPQGLLEDGEDAEAGGLRELREETGYVAERLQPIAELYASPAVQTGRVHVLLGEGARDTGSRSPDPEEEIDVRLAAIEDLERMIETGEVRAASSVAAALLVLRWFERR